jgi:hypothetical protein
MISVYISTLLRIPDFLQVFSICSISLVEGVGRKASRFLSARELTNVKHLGVAIGFAGCDNATWYKY